MKKIILLTLCLLCMSHSYAQKRVGQFSFIPRVGLNLSNLGDMDLYKLSNFKIESKARPDFMLGADVEYQLMEPLGVSVGAYYSRQGCRWADNSEQYDESSADNKKTLVTESWLDQAVTLQYINVPVSVKLYINDYFAVHAGVQAGFALDGRKNWAYSILKDPKEGDKTFISTQYSEKMRDLNPIVWSIPLGASFEYENVILDCRYNIPLSRFSDQQLVPSGYYSKGGNRVWTFSVGYRF